MRTFVLPQTDVEVSSICLGTAYFGTRVDEELSVRMLDYFVSQGGSFLNTAHEYGRGESERLIARWVKERRKRASIILTTKGGEDPTKPHCRALHYHELLEDANESLSRLGTDYLDFFLLHIDDDTVPVEEIVDALMALQQAGKVRYCGCSNWCPARIEAARAYAAKVGAPGFVMHEIEWNLARRNSPNLVLSTKWLDEDYAQYHERAGLTVGAYSPLAVGLFSKLAAAGGFEGLTEHHRRAYGNEYNAAMCERLQALSRQTGYSLVELQISYICSQPRRFASFPIVGCTTFVQLEEVLRGADCRVNGNMLDFLMAAPAGPAGVVRHRADAVGATV